MHEHHAFTFFVISLTSIVFLFAVTRSSLKAAFSVFLICLYSAVTVGYIIPHLAHAKFVSLHDHPCHMPNMPAQIAINVPKPLLFTISNKTIFSLDPNMPLFISSLSNRSPPNS